VEGEQAPTLKKRLDYPSDYTIDTVSKITMQKLVGAAVEVRVLVLRKGEANKASWHDFWTNTFKSKVDQLHFQSQRFPYIYLLAKSWR
jgi:hypothetical protein